MAAAVAGEAAVGTDHTMTRDNDRDAVVAVGSPHGARRRRAADAERDRLIGRGRAVGNREQGAPDARLERRSVEHERNGELLTRAGEILLELAPSLIEQPVLARD